jgi:myosin heavy subunit
MFERTFKVRPPWESFSISTTQPSLNKSVSSSILSSSSQINNANFNDKVSTYNDIEGKRRRQRRRQGDDTRVSAAASSSINLDDDASDTGDDTVDNTVDVVVEGGITPVVVANSNRSGDVDSSLVALIDSIDDNVMTSKRETQIDDNNNNDDDADMAAVASSTTRKYANRAALLESVLAIKVQELQVMTNRARLMEDALHRMKDERQLLIKTTMTTNATRAMMTTTTQQHHDDDDALDTTVESIQQSATVSGVQSTKSTLSSTTTALDEHAIFVSSTEKKLQTMTNRVVLLESTLLQMKTLLNEKEEVMQHERQMNEIKVEALQNEIQSLNSTIIKLRSQLTELLDEVDELDRRRNDEVNNAILSTTTKYKTIIHNMTNEYNKLSLILLDDKQGQHQIKNEIDRLSLLLKQEQLEKDEYRKLYKKEVRRRKKEGRKRQEAFQRALLAARIINDSSRSRLLTTTMSSNIVNGSKEEKEEFGVMEGSVDLTKLSIILANNSSSNDDTTPASNNDTTPASNNDETLPSAIEDKEGWSIAANNNNSIDDNFITSSRQREGMLLTDIEELEYDLSVANDKIHTLENQLRQTIDDQNKKSEQQQQLHEYLRAQLATYYDTIQEQAVQITNQTKQITNMQHQHDEAILIATRSVDAARQREETLLTNIEELENELTDMIAKRNDDAEELKQKKKEEEEKRVVVMNMKERLIELEELLLQGSAREKTLMEHNEELSKELIHHVRMANRVKAKLNTRQGVEEDKNEDGDDEIISYTNKNRDMKVPQSQQLRRRRRWLRPWSLLWER